VVFLAGIADIHALLITIAVWNAAKLYSGRSLWKWSAKLLAILSSAKWLWILRYAQNDNLVLELSHLHHAEQCRNQGDFSKWLSQPT
jgi:hypothetical protein